MSHLSCGQPGRHVGGEEAGQGDDEGDEDAQGVEAQGVHLVRPVLAKDAGEQEHGVRLGTS